MTESREHFGMSMLWNSSLGIAYRECWCGQRWIVTPRVSLPGHEYQAARWCPSAPVNLGSSPPRDTLLMSITEAVVEGVQFPFTVRAEVHRVSTPVAFCVNLPRALILAHTFHKMYAVSPGWTETLMHELQRAR